MSLARQNILVLDANQRSALAVVRSLGRQPHLRVVAADDTEESLAGNSRFCREYFHCPSPRKEPDAFVDWLHQIIGKKQIGWVFPVSEITSEIVAAVAPSLESCRVPLASVESLSALSDKWKLQKLADRLRVPFPESKFYANSAELEPGSIAEFPVVLKPCRSRLRLEDGWLDTAVHIARSCSECGQLLRDNEYLRVHPFMVQTFIPGSGAGVFALYDQGKPVAFFSHRRLREKPPEGGVSVLSESVALDSRLVMMARRLLDEVRWHGVAMVEFRVRPDGSPYLMEVNARFWGSLQLAVDAGADFPYWLLQISRGEKATVTDYRTGRRLRWLLGDLDRLYLVLRKRRDTSAAQKMSEILRFLTPHPFSTRHEVDRWSDPRPAWHELKTYLRALGAFRRQLS